MSRHLSNIDSEEHYVAQDYVNYVCKQAVPKAMTLQEIKLELEKNISPQALIKAIETDQWIHPEVQEYRNVKDELLVYQGTVLTTSHSWESLTVTSQCQRASTDGS